MLSFYLYLLSSSIHLIKITRQKNCTIYTNSLLSWTGDGLQKELEKVIIDFEKWSYWTFKTIELKIVSVPYYINRFSDYFYWCFGTILIIFWLHHVGCTRGGSAEVNKRYLNVFGGMRAPQLVIRNKKVKSKPFIS